MIRGARLRALRVVGFKSFAEKTVLEFGPGISAVVGPNGSGKSNLADALRWALGEQGRSLRTRKSEDVIFAGSAKRHAIGMADVSLVIDNGDRLLPIEYAEVDLGRRLYRSGENEYLMNRQKVRLRDLIDLLDAANLADNAFLFIGQGMVDQALSLRPEERRPLFEEAAGVRRHERRRRQAEERLVEAEANLARVRDIIGELRPQVRRLAAQAEQQAARRDAAAELAEGLVAAARARFTTAGRDAANARAALLSARREADEGLRTLTAAEEGAASIAGALAERDEIARSARAALDAIRLRVTELRLAAAQAQGEIAAAERERARLAAEGAALDARIADGRRTLALPLPEKDRGAEAALATIDGELAAAGAELARAEETRAVASERGVSLRRIQAARSAEAEVLRRRATEAAHRADETRRARDVAEAAAGAASDHLRNVTEGLTAARAAEAVAVRAADDARAAAEAAESLRFGRASRAGVLDERLEAGRARLATLAALLAERERGGIGAAARRRGGRRVAEGLDVEASLRTAVEAALGETIRAAAVPQSAVLPLRGERGQLVLADAQGAVIAGRELARALEAVRAANGGPLVDAIRRDPEGHVSRLLATVLWVPELDDALGLRAVLPAGWRIVTAAGEVVSADGVVTLGRPDPILERRAEHDRLARELDGLAAEAADAATALAAATREAAVARQGAAAASGALDHARQGRLRAEEEERVASRTAEQAGRELAWEAAQLERLASEAERAATAAREAVAPAGAAPDGRLDEGADDASLAAWRARVEELRARRRSAAVAAEVASQAGRAAEDRRRRAEVALGIDEERLAAVDAATVGYAEAADVARRALSGTSAELAAARDADAAAADALAALEAAETDERRRLVALEAEAAVARERLRRAEERARAAEVTEMEARLGLDAVRESFLVELAGLGSVGLAALRSAAGEVVAAAEHVDPDDDAFAAELEAALEAAILAWTAAGPTGATATAVEPPSPGRQTALRRRYHELGASNPFAAEEHAAVRDRLADLETQQDDLLAAISGTRQLIAELTQRIAEQFQATFVALEGAFARRFAQLFDGGEASLLLTEPEALTQTGVEIMARPPGKKRQALAMLSGGERALTAVALLFAILEVRPVPFCVLDEVDAALDEANVTRFATALRELAAGTQFIVITHNRGTIESADALYGVTIGDDAVSRVISLRLDEANELVAAAG